MPIDNGNFEDDLQTMYKYTGGDLVERVSSFRYDLTMFQPVTYDGIGGQGFFTRLDGPKTKSGRKLVNNEGERSVDAREHVVKATLESLRELMVDEQDITVNFLGDSDTDPAITVGGDGIYIEHKNTITIPVGKSLIFHYAFLNYDTKQKTNDFAILHANPVNPNKRIQQIVIDYRKRDNITLLDAEVRRLGSVPSNAPESRGRWIKAAWTPGPEFVGTIRWMLWNGLHLQNKQRLEEHRISPDPICTSWPSCLLLDAIEIGEI